MRRVVRAVLLVVVAVGWVYMLFASGWSGTVEYVLAAGATVGCGWIASRLGTPPDRPPTRREVREGD